MLRKLFVTLAGAGLSDPYLQIIAALMILIVSFGLQSFFQPYEPLALDILDSLGIFCLLCTQILSILYLYVDTSDTLIIDQAYLEYGVTFGLFALNATALLSFVFGYVVAYLQLDWRAFRCAKRISMRLVVDPAVIAKALVVAAPEEEGELADVLAAAGDGEKEKENTHYWKHPTTDRVMTWAPKHIGQSDDDTQVDFWIYLDAKGNFECASNEAPQLLERIPPEEDQRGWPGETICFLDVLRMEASPLLTVPDDFGGISLCCKKVEVRPRREVPGKLLTDDADFADGGGAGDGTGIAMVGIQKKKVKTPPIRHAGAGDATNMDNPMFSVPEGEGGGGGDDDEAAAAGAAATAENPMQAETSAAAKKKKKRVARAAQRSKEETTIAVAGAARDVPVVGGTSASARRRERGRERAARRNGAREAEDVAMLRRRERGGRRRAAATPE